LTRKYVHGKECEKVRKRRKAEGKPYPFCNGLGCGYVD